MLGRNELCPCGSGKKYKRCCLNKDVVLERAERKVGATQKQYSELSDICKEGKQELISKLRGKLVERALGGSYTEERTTTKIVAGVEQIETIKITKMALPDVAAINLCLKNYDKENWSENPQNLELKKQELELKKTIAEANSFDIDLEKM